MAFLNNWLEMRSDAFKIMTHSRRPLPKRVESIGAWLDCMVSSYCLVLGQNKTKYPKRKNGNWVTALFLPSFIYIYQS